MKHTVVPDAAQCAGCLTCMLRCSFRFEGTFNLSASRVKVKRLVNQPAEFEITFTKECDGCGLCAKYCPYGALIRLKAGEEYP